MNKSQALKEAVKRWGKEAVVMDNRIKTSAAERDAAREQRKLLLATLTPEEKKKRHRELDDLLSRALRHRYQVGKHGGFFISVRGYGDTWEQAFECADRMWGKAAA